MPFTAATSQTLVEAARQAIVKADKAIEQYMLTNNPGILATVDAALLAASTAITTLRT